MSSSSALSPVHKSPWQTWMRLLVRPVDHDLVRFLLLGVWCGFLFYYGLTAAELWRTESLRAIIAEGMLRSGNWIVPTLYGEPLFTKPPGMYVAIVLCSLPLGRVTELTARLPSALSATLTVILFYRLFRRSLGRLGGAVAALVLPMSLIYLDKTSAAEIDMMHLAWVMGAVVCFLRVLEEGEREAQSAERSALGASRSATRPILLWWLLTLGCLAGGVLTKWTAPVFFYGMALPLLWWRGRLRLLWCWQHLVSVVAAASLCLSWVVAAVVLTGWDVFYATVLQEALPRIVPFYDKQYHQHHSYWLEVLRHPLWIMATTLPWSVVALWTLRPSFAGLWDERGRRLLAALHCWTWPNLLFWTLVSDHKPRHSMPLCPGLAGLAIMVLVAWITGKLPLPWPRIQPRKFLAGALVCWLAIKVVYVEIIMPRRSGLGAPREKGLLIASLVPLGTTLFLFRLKDEGIMFYFGGTAVRLKSFAQLPSSPEPVYCILDRSECQGLAQSREVEVVHSLTDEQGEPIVLVRVKG